MRKLLLFITLFVASLSPARAWDYEGHRFVNQVALASLPTNFPAFVFTPAARERIAFLAGEADRWRNSPELTLKHFNSPDHFLDIDDLHDYGLAAESLSSFRYEFAGQLAVARTLHPTNFPPIDPKKNEDRTRTLVGFLPWTLTEYYGKLKSAFSYLKAYEENGTPEEIQNAQQNIIYIMGVMGHFAGDAAQPLHTTKHFNGWVGTNPKNYATNTSFHGWIDGGYMKRAELNFAELKPHVRPAQLLPRQENIFPLVMEYLLNQHKLVEPLYQLNQNGSLSDKGEPGSKGRAFFTQQLLSGGQLLGNLWLTAWQSAPPDTYLKGQLAKRQLQSGNAPEIKK